MWFSTSQQADQQTGGHDLFQHSGFPDSEVSALQPASSPEQQAAYSYHSHTLSSEA